MEQSNSFSIISNLPIAQGIWNHMKSKEMEGFDVVAYILFWMFIA